MVLTALRLPGNIEQRLAAIQTRLFAELGLLSARALPPLVPLAWGAGDRRGAPPARIPSLTLGTVELAGSALLVPVAPAAPVSALAAAVATPEGGAAPGAAGAAGNSGAPFPIPRPGVLLAPVVAQEAARAATATAGAAAERAAVTGVVVRRFGLVEIEILTWRGEEPEYVVWREIGRAPLRATPRR